MKRQCHREVVKCDSYRVIRRTKPSKTKAVLNGYSLQKFDPEWDRSVGVIIVGKLHF
jgi:hypothetical protein